jgi:hypothetical protein
MSRDHRVERRDLEFAWKIQRAGRWKNSIYSKTQNWTRQCGQKYVGINRQLFVQNRQLFAPDRQLNLAGSSQIWKHCCTLKTEKTGWEKYEQQFWGIKSLNMDSNNLKINKLSEFYDIFDWSHWYYGEKWYIFYLGNSCWSCCELKMLESSIVLYSVNCLRPSKK